MTLFLSSRSEGAWVVVEVKGRLDGTTAAELRGCLDTVLADPHRPVVRLIADRHRSVVRLIADLSELSYCDVDGLGVFVGARNRVEQQRGEFRLVCPDGRVLQVLRISRLARVLPVYRTLDRALSVPAHT